MAAILHVSTHPLIRRDLDVMRNENTLTGEFRARALAVTRLLGAEVLADAATASRRIFTPLEEMQSTILWERFNLVSVTRGGNGFLQGMMELLPDAAVGYLNIQRDHATALPAEQGGHKLPNDLGRGRVIVLDPMLATGGSAAMALDFVKAAGAKNITFMSLISAPEGVAKLAADHPDVPVFTAALDRCLDDKKYIRPGIGDFGARWHGTSY